MVAEQTNSKEVQNAVRLPCSCRAHFSMTGYVMTLPQIAALKRHEVLKKLSTTTLSQQCSKYCDAAQCMWHYSGILSIMDYALGGKVGNNQVHHAARGHLHLKRITLTVF